MVVFLDGEYVPEERAVIPVNDRSFLYGDGLFETLPIYKGVPFRWRAHMERLQQGLNLLRIKTSYSPAELEAHAKRLVELNAMPDAVLRLTVSRGSGARGYSIKLAQKPRVVMTLHPLSSRPAAGWRLITSKLRVVAEDVIQQSKTCSRLRSVLARAEAEDQGADEALLLNERGEITEGAATNFFCIFEGPVCTPPLAAGILPGVTRAAVLEVCRELGIKTEERGIVPGEVQSCAGAFVTVSTMGVVDVVSLDSMKLAQSPVVARVRDAYWQLVEREARE
jgi:branched-chain amino acid aminotransferase